MTDGTDGTDRMTVGTVPDNTAVRRTTASASCTGNTVHTAGASASGARRRRVSVGVGARTATDLYLFVWSDDPGYWFGLNTASAGVDHDNTTIRRRRRLV